MERTDITIVGAGAVGLACAAGLSGAGLEITVVERHDRFGRETSSRNSEVVHAGIYYPAGSLKASLCVEGRRALYDLCRRAGIPHRKTGKLIVAPQESDLSHIERLKERGEANGVEGLRLLSRDEVRRLEPDVTAAGALLSPETGIFDSHSFMAHLDRAAEAVFAYNCALEGLAPAEGGWLVRIRDADGESFDFLSRVVINAAGLGAEAVARMAGIDTAAAGYTLYPCKGEYFRLQARGWRRPERLVYPPPTEISLGIHTVIDLQGGMKLGPNAFYVDEIEYSVDEGHREEFFRGAREYLPRIEEEDLTPDMAGIRPKLYREGEPVRDFVIRHEADRGLPGLVDLLGIESPGLTASPAIGKLVAGMAREALR